VLGSFNGSKAKIERNKKRQERYFRVMACVSKLRSFENRQKSFKEQPVHPIM
jgi:hypothetical protein